MKKLITILFLLIATGLLGATFNSIQDGGWGNDNTWDGVGVPSSNGDVIHIYHDVVMTSNITFSFDSLIIHPGGSLIGNYDLTVKSGCYLGVYDSLEVCDLEFANGSIVYIDATANVQVNCDFTNKNNSDDVTINGSVNVDGEFYNGTGGVVIGSGTITAGTYTGSGSTFGIDPNSTIPPGSTVSDPLPIELLYFNGKYVDNVVVLTWKTATEINNDYFTIEKSADGITFFEIKYISGAGNSNYPIEYMEIDEHVQVGNVYYKLKQTDFDGSYAYSKVISVHVGGIMNKSFEVFPNPAKKGETIFISCNGFEKEVLVVVYDIFGAELYSKVVITEYCSGYVEAIDKMDKLPSGTYIIIASSMNEIYKKKLIIR